MNQSAASGADMSAEMETILTRAVKKFFKWQLSGLTGTLIVASMLWFAVFFLFFLILAFVMCVEYHYENSEREADAERVVPEDGKKHWAEKRSGSRESSGASLKKVVPIPMPPLPVNGVHAPKAVFVPEEPEEIPEPEPTPVPEAVQEPPIVEDVEESPIADAIMEQAEEEPVAEEEEEPVADEEAEPENTQEEDAETVAADDAESPENDDPPPEEEEEAPEEAVEEPEKTKAADPEPEPDPGNSNENEVDEDKTQDENASAPQEEDSGVANDEKPSD